MIFTKRVRLRICCVRLCICCCRSTATLGVTYCGRIFCCSIKITVSDRNLGGRTRQVASARAEKEKADRITHHLCRTTKAAYCPRRGETSSGACVLGFIDLTASRIDKLPQVQHDCGCRWSEGPARRRSLVVRGHIGHGQQSVPQDVAPG